MLSDVCGFFYRIARPYSAYVLEDFMHTRAYSKLSGLSQRNMHVSLLLVFFSVRSSPRPSIYKGSSVSATAESTPGSGFLVSHVDCP